MSESTFDWLVDQYNQYTNAYNQTHQADAQGQNADSTVRIPEGFEDAFSALQRHTLDKVTKSAEAILFVVAQRFDSGQFMGDVNSDEF